MKCNGKIAIVTGAGRGLGRGIARKLAQEGAVVVACDVALENVQETVKLIDTEGGKAKAMACNVASLQDVEALFQSVIGEYGQVDVLVNNAGINRDSMIHKMSIEQWDQVIAVNLTGTFYMTQAAVKHMRERDSGRIINISSASWLGNVGQANYAASKAGLVGMARSLAKEVARRGITCNCVSPGFIDTDFIGNLSEEQKREYTQLVPCRRFGRPEEVAGGVFYLLGPQAGYVTGTVLEISGGL